MINRKNTMTKVVCLVFVAMALVLANSVPGYAFRGAIVIGPGWWPYPYYWGPYPYYGAPYPYYVQPPVVQEQPPVVQEQSPVYVEPAPQPQQQQQQNYWYYCPDPQGYYPYVKECPKGWQKVLPAPPSAETGK